MKLITNSYVILIIALLIEVFCTSLLKWSNGMSKLWVGVTAYAFYGLSIYLFSLAIQHINLAVADTIWQGLGIILITCVSYFLFKEPLSMKQLFFIGVTMTGVIGLGLSN